MATTEAPQPVTIGMLDGATKVGSLSKFRPQLMDLQIEIDRWGKTLIAAERVAYIAFYRDPGARSVLPFNQSGLERMRIHMAGGKVFPVMASSSESQSALGFWAYPADEDTPFKQYYFYAHGVNRRERDVPIGEMLVDGGHVGQQTLKRAIDQQNENKAALLGQILVEQGADPQAIAEAAELQKRRKLRIGEILIEAGIASKEDVDRALSEQKNRKGKRIGEVLVDLGIVKEEALAQTLAKKFGLAFAILDEIKINPNAPQEVSVDLIHKYGVLPIDSSPSALTVAISDPLAVEAIDVLRFQVKRRIDEVVVPASQLKQAVADYLTKYEAQKASTEVSLDEILKQMSAEELKAGAEEDADDDDKAKVDKEEEGGIIRLVNQIIIDAYRAGASDIHIEPNGKDRNALVRFRIDGDCQAYQEIPANFRAPLIARIKVMAKLDISERRKPQDGKIRFRLGDRQIELRVATLPTVNNNEDAVLRILASSKPLPVEQIGLSNWNLRELKRLVAQPYGLILCVGPTGSGKTTTLHSALGSINTVDTKIWTAEDPVEITQPGLRQVQVQSKIGFTFAAAMRAFLRADPDVIMVGEMRDEETASTAVEASLTGHLVLSTLHTNSAPETITRLLDMGLDPFSFADSLLGVLAQRLARGLCKKCRYQRPATEEEIGEIIRAYGTAEVAEQKLGTTLDADFKLWSAKGCPDCKNTGYKGRLAIHELLITDKDLKRQIAQKSPVDQLRTAAIQLGMSTLLQDGIAKAIAGTTDLKQVLGVCSG